MKTIKEHSLLAALIVFVFLVFCRDIPGIAAVLLGCVWYERTHNSSFVLITLLLCILAVPVWKKELPQINSGRVIEVHSSYAVVRNGRTKVLLYTEQQPLLDSTVSFSGEFREISSQISFYGFDFAEYCAERGVYWYAVCDPEELNKTHSMRGRLTETI